MRLGCSGTSNCQPSHTSVALFEEEAVAKVAFVVRIGRPAGAVEDAQHAFAAAVRNLKQHRAVSGARIFRFEDVDVGGELDLAFRIARSFVDIDDDAVGREAWVHGKEGAPNHAFVTSESVR